MKKTNKKIVEIYFILYIAAIIFLLPDREKSELKINDIDSEFFTLQPFKTTLFCRYYFDSTEIKIISIDSVNIIKSNLDINDLSFDFEIEDLSLKQKLFIDEESTYFKFFKSNTSNELIFKWYPQFKPDINKTYILNILAYKNINNSLKKQFLGQTQFSLLLVDVTNEITANQDSIRLTNQLPNILSPDYYIQKNNKISEIVIEAHSYDIKSLAYRNWSNKIYIFGANPSEDLKYKPQINLSSINEENLGTCEVQDITNNSIVLKGKTPIFGKMKVTVTLKFSFENKSRIIDFYVSAIPIPKPELPSIIYPYKKYEIDPKLPLIAEQKIYCIVKLNSQIIKTSYQGEVIPIIFNENDIGKTLSIGRYIDDELYDKYSIAINDYPVPIIYDIQVDVKDNVKIITNSYGYYKNERNLVHLEVKGNVNVRELRGRIQNDGDVFIQVFECNPKNQNDPFEFSVQAVDKRGQKSIIKKFP